MRRTGCRRSVEVWSGSGPLLHTVSRHATAAGTNAVGDGLPGRAPGTPAAQPAHRGQLLGPVRAVRRDGAAGYVDAGVRGGAAVAAALTDPDDRHRWGA